MDFPEKSYYPESETLVSKAKSYIYYDGQNTIENVKALPLDLDLQNVLQLPNVVNKFLLLFAAIKLDSSPEKLRELSQALVQAGGSSSFVYRESSPRSLGDLVTEQEPIVFTLMKLRQNIMCQETQLHTAADSFRAMFPDPWSHETVRTYLTDVALLWIEFAKGLKETTSQLKKVIESQKDLEETLLVVRPTILQPQTKMAVLDDSLKHSVSP